MKSDSPYSFRFNEMVRPGRLELPISWFVAIGAKTLNVLFGVAYGLETPFFRQLATPNPRPKTELCRTFTDHFMSSNCSIRKAKFGFSEPTSWYRTMAVRKSKPLNWLKIPCAARSPNALPFALQRVSQKRCVRLA